MEELKVFLLANWSLIASILLFCVAVIVTILKGKKKGLSITDILLGFVLDAVPHWINVAEASGGTGDQKRIMVLNQALTLTAKELGRQLTEQESALIVSHVSTKIEEVLSTPQKKEAKKLGGKSNVSKYRQ